MASHHCSQQGLAGLLMSGREGVQADEEIVSHHSHWFNKNESELR
jgi:hypothetical protein